MSCIKSFATRSNQDFKWKCFLFSSMRHNQNSKYEDFVLFPFAPCTKPSVSQRSLPRGVVVTCPCTMDLSRWSTACLASAGRSGCSMSATTFHTASTACWGHRQNQKPNQKREAGKLSSSWDLQPAASKEFWQFMIKMQGFHVWSSVLRDTHPAGTPSRHQIQPYTPGTGIPHSTLSSSGNICAEAFTQLQDEFKTNWGLLINKAGDKETPLNIISYELSWISPAFSFQEAKQLHPLLQSWKVGQTNFLLKHKSASGITHFKKLSKQQESLRIVWELLLKFSSFQYPLNTLELTSSIFLVFATSQIWLIARILLLNPHSMLSSWKEMEK